VSTLLNSWGYRTEAAVDADSALAILGHAVKSADPYRIALLDMSLPGVDGKELGRRIAADPQLSRTLLLLMTGVGEAIDRGQMEGLGFAWHVHKLIVQPRLRKALECVG